MIGSAHKKHILKTCTEAPIDAKVLRGVIKKWAVLHMPQDSLEFARNRLKASPRLSGNAVTRLSS